MDVEMELRKAQTVGPRWEEEYREHLLSTEIEEVFVFEKFREKRRALDFLIREDPCATDDWHTMAIFSLEQELGIYGGRNDNG